MKTEIPVCPKIKTEAYKSVFIASETPYCHTLEKYLLSSLSHWIKELSSCIAMERLTTQSNKTKTKNPHILQDLGLWHILLNFLRQLTLGYSEVIKFQLSLAADKGLFSKTQSHWLRMLPVV